MRLQRPPFHDVHGVVTCFVLVQSSPCGRGCRGKARWTKTWRRSSTPTPPARYMLRRTASMSSLKASAKDDPVSSFGLGSAPTFQYSAKLRRVRPWLWHLFLQAVIVGAIGMSLAFGSVASSQRPAKGGRLPPWCCRVPPTESAATVFLRQSPGCCASAGDGAHGDCGTCDVDRLCPTRMEWRRRHQSGRDAGGRRTHHRGWSDGV